MPSIQNMVGSSGDGAGFLNPRVGLTSVPSDSLSSDDPANLERRRQMTETLFKTKYGEDKDENTGARVAKYLAGGAIDAVDTVASSLSPLDRGAVWQGAREMGLTGLADFAQRNESGVQLTGGVVAALATGYAAEAYIVPLLTRAALASTMLSGTSLVAKGAQYVSSARAVATSAAESAAINGEAVSVFKGVGKQLLAARVGTGLAKGAISEAAIAATTHSNKEVWSDDASTNLWMMAAGLGISGAVGAIGARFEMRQIANSDEVMNLRAASSDPWGYSAIREIQPSEAELKALGPNARFKESVNTTGYAVSARQTVPENLPARRKELILNEAKQAEIQMGESVQKITSKGLDGAPGSSFSNYGDKNKPAFKHVTDTLHNDPTALMGLDSLGTGNFGLNVKNVEAHIKELGEQFDDPAALRKARELSERTPMGLVNQVWMPDTPDMRALGDYRPGEVKLEKINPNQGTTEFKIELNRGKVIRLNQGGNITGPAASNFGNWRIDDQLKVYEGINKQINTGIGKKETLTLGAKPTWLQVDMALEYQRRGGTIDFTTHMGAAGIKSAEDLEMLSLRMKAAEALKLSKQGKFDFWARAKLNLPLPGSLERIHDGTSEGMTAVLNGLIKNPNMTKAEAVALRKQTLELSNLRDGLKSTDPAVNGDMFNFNRTKNGEWQPVVTGYFSPSRVSPELAGTQEQLLLETSYNKAYRFQQLQRSGLTQEITTRLVTDPNLERSMRILGLADDQVTGLGSEASQALGSVVTKSMRERDSVVMTALSNVRQMVDRVKDDYISRFFQGTFQGAQNSLAAAPAKGSKLLVNQYLSFAGGWDLKPGFVPHSGMAAVELADTPRNAARLGRAVGEDELLTSPLTGNPIVLDQTAQDFITRFQIGAKQLLKDSNNVRLSRNLTPIEFKAHYVPAPDTKGKVIGFTIGQDGKVVPGKTVVASNQSEFERLAEVQRANNEPGERFVTQAALESTADLWDQAEMGWIDPGFVGAKKAGQTGGLQGSVLNQNAVEDALDWMKGRIEAIANGTVRSMYDQQLAIVRARSVAQATVEGGVDKAGRNIYDEYDATINGVPLSKVKPTRFNNILNEVDKPIQAVIDTGWPLVRAIGATRVAQWVDDITQKMGMKPVRGFKSFEDMAEQMGEHTPFAKAQQWADSNLKVPAPPEVRAIAGKVNKLTAAMLLRWFEIPNAAMNMIGIVTNMPSILRSPNTPLVGNLISGAGKKIGVVDSHKILAAAFGDMLRKEKHADWDLMVRNGDTTQSVFELNRQLSLIESKSTWGKVMGGDKNRMVPKGMPKSRKELSDWVANKGVDGIISLATDTTESTSRAWAHFVGLRLADLNGIVGQQARHDFARDVANQAIANYNPLNRPELFQSSVGSMFGLFTSYMQQYNQRLFRWMETKDYASVGRQLAMQSTLFGTPSVSGYNALDWFFQGQGENPDATLTDAIYAKYGPKVGAVIAHGGVTEISRLFGFDNGVALYTRGDANFRSPTLDPTRLMAGMNMLSSVTNMMWDVGSKAIDPNADISMRYLSDTIARNLPNRAMKGTMQLLLGGGNEIDSSGQIISDAKGMFEYSLRAMGVRSTRQQGEVEAYYANASLRRAQASRMETLRESTRAKIRSGEPLEPMELFNRYTKNGGSPSHFQTWIQDVMKSQQDSRGMNEFMKSLRSPTTQLEAWRYDVRQ